MHGYNFRVDDARSFDLARELILNVRFSKHLFSVTNHRPVLLMSSSSLHHVSITSPSCRLQSDFFCFFFVFCVCSILDNAPLESWSPNGRTTCMRVARSFAGGLKCRRTNTARTSQSMAMTYGQYKWEESIREAVVGPVFIGRDDLVWFVPVKILKIAVAVSNWPRR